MMSTTIENIDRQILDLLQNDFPLTSRPFADIGRNLGLTEREALARVKNLQREGIIRQISAIFDTRRIGYDSCLVAMQVPPERLDQAAAVINEHPGVSHNYSRSHLFNLWFTIATPPGQDLTSDVDMLSDKAGAKATLLLPALRVFKIGVKLDVTGTKDPLSTETNDRQSMSQEASPPLTGAEIAVVRELQENIPVEETPFYGMANRLGITEKELFAVAKRFIAEGHMRRFAAVLRHQKAGFKANAMGVWVVPQNDPERIGSLLAAFQAVSHCYERPPHPPAWPYNIFTMVHARTTEECLNILSAMSRKVGITQYDYLFSEKEYKKARVRYFVKKDDEEAYPPIRRVLESPRERVGYL